MKNQLNERFMTEKSLKIVKIHEVKTDYKIRNRLLKRSGKYELLWEWTAAYLNTGKQQRWHYTYKKVLFSLKSLKLKNGRSDVFSLRNVSIGESIKRHTKFIQRQ